MFARMKIGLIGLPGFAALVLSASVHAQGLQDGDIVIGANYLDNFYNWNGRFHLLRGNNLTTLFDTGTSGIGFSFPGDVFIDSHGRIVFSAGGGCGNNSNSTAIDRFDPATGTLSQLLCVPYIVGSGGPPAGLPNDADGFYGFAGLHLTRVLRVTIDDDVNGGVPQVSAADAYAFSVGVHRPSQGNQYEAGAFRFNPDTGAVEPGISLALLPLGGSGALMCAGSGGTYYSNGSKVGLAGPDLNVNLNAHTTVGGVDISVQGTLHVSPKNEIIFDGGVLDNTAIPNGSASCSIGGVQVNDDNVPFNSGGYFDAFSVSNIGTLDGNLFATSSSGATGVPWLFSLSHRDPFLNPYCCCFYTCISHNGPYAFFQNPPPLFNTTTQQGRVLGGDDNGGRVFSVSPSGFQMLASGLGRPHGVAAYPPDTPALSAAVLVVRVDSPLNVLVTDASGHRIGHDAAGNTVNDFGASGAILALGPEGHPRVYAVINPPTGTYSVNAVGTGDGPYTIRSYLAESSTGGAFIARTGQAQMGVSEDLALHIHGPLTQAWLRLGDLNCDGSIDAIDVSPFVQALIDPAGYAAQFPSCELFNADINRDSLVNGGDIQPFMMRLIQG